MQGVIRLEIPTPFNSGPVNCYGFSEAGLAVIDPGPATPAAYDALTTGLAEHGFSVADIDQVLITHPHMDHFGLANRVVQASGASVVAHHDATSRLGDPIGHFDHEVDLLRPLFETHGVPAHIIETAVAHTEDFNAYQEPLAVDRPLTDGDTVDVGADLTAIHTPGHAPGSVCYLAASDAVAYTGDHVLQHLTPNPRLTVVPGSEAERTRSLPTYLAALKKLQAFNAEFGHAGHGQPITDLHGRIQETLDHHRRRKDRIATILEERASTTAYAIVQEMFPELPATQVVLGMSEVIGHLDLLEDDDAVAIADVDGIRRYRLR